MRRMALFGSATLLGAVLALPSGCNDTRRDWDVCHSEPCREGFRCDAHQRCVAIVAATVDASAEGGRPDGSAIADGGDGSADADASTDVVADAVDDGAMDGADQDATQDADQDADASSTTDGAAD
jgi:hypothetical protein